MRVRTPTALAVFVGACLLLPGSSPSALTVQQGYDLLETDPATTFTDVDLPANFFGPGSEPFEGRVYFSGVPFDSFDPDGLGGLPAFTGLLPTDTIVRRIGDAGPTFPDTVQIELVELHLVSVQPIVVTFGGGGGPQLWEVRADVSVDPSGTVVPPQTLGTMTLEQSGPAGGTFDSQLPVDVVLSFSRLDGPGAAGPLPAPTITLRARGAPWCDHANPLVTPWGDLVIAAPGLTTNFFPSVFCEEHYPERPPVTYSVDGGALNAARNGLPLTPFPNPADGLRVPDPRHVPPNDVYALGLAPGANGYATEGEVFQSAGAPLGTPPNTTNVDRMSAALGVGPAPAGPPFLGPFAPNPGGPAPAPLPPGVAGPPGAFGPPPGHAVGVLGLVPNDNVDALSYGRDSGNVLLFSVDPAAVGVPFSAVRTQAVLSPFAAAAAPPFPTNPGGGDPGAEAAGDIFKSVQLANFGRYIGVHFAAGAFIAPAVFLPNQLEVDEVLLGLQASSANGSSSGPPEDDLDGLEYADTGDPFFGVDHAAPFAAAPDGIPDRFAFFSIDAASPSNGLVLPPFTVSPDDILVAPPGGFSFSVYADGVLHVGLLAGDDLDGLALSDVAGLGILDPGLDEALFSFHPGSPMVLFGCDGLPASGDEVSAADVFYTNFTVPFCPVPPVPYASAAALGLLGSDNLNALDILPSRIHPRPSRPPIPPPNPAKKLTWEQQLLARHGVRPPEKRRYLMASVATIEFETDFGPAIANLQSPPGQPMVVERLSDVFHPETAQTEIPVEIVSMNLQGPSPLGPVIVRGGRDFGLPPSSGGIGPGASGIPLPAESFFDVYVEIELPAFGLLLHNPAPIPLRAPIDEIPPLGSEYQYAAEPPSPGIELVDQFGNPAGFVRRVVHTPRCSSDEDCDDDGDACTLDLCVLASGQCLHEPLPDSDGDGVCDEADNCASLANTGGQSLLEFDQTIVAPDPGRFCWGVDRSVSWVRGDLALVSNYAIDLGAVSVSGACLLDPDLPGPGTGTWYAVRHECAAGSWQNAIGSEPQRDRALP